MLATAIVAVTAVGVSTAQVVNALTAKHSNTAQISTTLPSAATEMAAELEVLVGTLPESQDKLLFLENMKNEEITISHLNCEPLSQVAESNTDLSGCTTLEPKGKVSLVIDGSSSTKSENSHSTKSGNLDRLVSMKGQVVGGRLVLFGN